jgi:hypothetical protein
VDLCRKYHIFLPFYLSFISISFLVQSLQIYQKE